MDGTLSVLSTQLGKGIEAGINEPRAFEGVAKEVAGKDCELSDNKPHPGIAEVPRKADEGLAVLDGSRDHSSFDTDGVFKTAKESVYLRGSDSH
jgi:hypothetical protein